ncbi:MAG: N-6 DNA methylase [Neisseriaceae bacterium]|nr:N-6 DNA methylase [Neisseriaceae bacterium]
MSLFKAKILAQYTQDEQVIEERYAVLRAYQRIAESIKDFKEEQYQTGFLEEIFEKCLGYALKIHNPKNYNLEREKKNETDGKKADAVIYNPQGEVIAVIELKDQKSQDLSKAVEQAFNYHNNHKSSKYIIVSNFNELRFYIDKKTDYEKFDLFTMDKDEFRRFYLILNYQSIISDLPIEIKQKSDMADADISKKLYADFADFRLALFNNAKQNNPNISQKKLLRLIQKFCDRIIFILFAEDKGLLKPNTIAEIESKHNSIKGIADISLYQFYQKYFQAIDKGNTDLGIMPYNGGLFADDIELNQLTISDNILETHLPKLSAYDFKSDISVNILGHIFEQSLSDLEELNAAIDNQQFDYNQSKRKKDGIFYTPEYITQFIVEQTLGKICLDKKEELGLNEEIRLPEKIKKKLNKEEQNLLDRLYQYRNFLLELKIIDPACGSGAFLNQALEFLIKEHAFIDKYRRILENESLGLYDIEIAILENNLYGVDINADAVEIAKLSLWLRTAQKGRKLTDLSNNIKCGNSLIDDKTVDKNAFIWQNEFPQIMANGGFDIVIGNPPYGAKISKEHIKNIIEQVSDWGISNALNDTYFVFYAKSLKQLLKDKGYLGFITPNTWKLIENANLFRQKLFNENFKIYYIVQYIDKVFEDATVDCDTLLIQKNVEPELIQIDFVKNQSVYKTHQISQKTIAKQDFFNLFLTDKDYLLKDELVIKNGVKPYEKGKGNPPQTAETLKIKPYTSETKIDDTFSPLIGGSYFHRYNVTWDNNYWIKYGEWLAAPRKKEIFDANEKLIFRQTSDSIIGTFIGNDYIMRDNTHIVLSKNDKYHLKYVLAVLNSKLLNYYYWTMNPEKGEAMAQVKAFHLGLLPIKDIVISEQQPFIELADKMLSLNAELNDKKSRFIRRLQQNFAHIKIKGGLTQFWQLSFADFVNELKKQKIKLTLNEQDEWEEYFSQYQTHLTALQQEITTTDKTIDTMVYQLYNLTDEEIKIVEQA